MEFSGECKRLYDSLKETYNLSKFDKFLTVNPGETFNYTMDIFLLNTKIRVGNVWIKGNPEEIELYLVQRIHEEHKGVMKQILYLIICKAIQLNLPIRFMAVSNCSSKFCDPTTLYKYYNTIGFQRVNGKNDTPNSEKETIAYHTSVETLQHIINSLSPEDKTRKSRKSRKARRTRRTRKN